MGLVVADAKITLVSIKHIAIIKAIFFGEFISITVIKTVGTR